MATEPSEWAMEEARKVLATERGEMNYALHRVATALDAAVAREREDWMREAQKWIDAYPLSKWPEPPPNTTPEQERISADMGRHVGRCMVRFGRARDAKAGDAKGEQGGR